MPERHEHVPTFPVREPDGGTIHVPYLPNLGEHRQAPEPAGASSAGPAIPPPPPTHAQTSTHAHGLVHRAFTRMEHEFGRELGALRHAASQELHAALQAAKSLATTIAHDPEGFARNAVATAWNAVAGDDLKTLAGKSPWYDKTMAAADLAANFVPGAKFETLATKEAVRAAERLGEAGIERALEASAKSAYRAPESAFYDGKFRSYGSFADKDHGLGPAGEGKEWHHGVPQALGTNRSLGTEHGIDVDRINDVERLYPVETKQHRAHSYLQNFKNPTTGDSQMDRWKEGLANRTLTDEKILAQDRALMRKAGLDPKELNAQTISRWEKWKERIIETGQAPESFYKELEKIRDARHHHGHDGPQVDGPLRATYSGVDRSFGIGFQLRGRVTEAQDDRIVQSVGRGEEVVYSRRELLSHANPADRTAMNDALQPGNVLQIGIGPRGDVTMQRQVEAEVVQRQATWQPVTATPHAAQEAPSLGR